MRTSQLWYAIVSCGALLASAAYGQPAHPFHTEVATIYGVAQHSRQQVPTKQMPLPVLKTTLAPPPGNATPVCNFKNDPNAPVAPAKPFFVADQDESGHATFYFFSESGVTTATAVYDSISSTWICNVRSRVSWNDFWVGRQSQDRINFGDGAEVTYTLTPAFFGTKRVLYVVARAGSTFNNDQTLFVAVAKAASTSKVIWQQFRIPLTHVQDGTHFCAPSATATVLMPLRIGSAPAGRLFVAFNSYENSTTTGSILSFSLSSLLNGGPARVKCFMDATFAYAQPPDVRDGITTAYFLDAPIVGSVIHRFTLTIGSGVANDTFAATPDIEVPFYGDPPAAVQPNGFHLYPCCGAWFRRPTIQIGNSLWNVHTVDEGSGHPKVRLYKFDATATAPLMELSFNTRGDGTDDLISPSVDTDSDAPGTEAYVTFVRTVSGLPKGGNATLMQASGPNDSASGWTTKVLSRSVGQFTQDAVGNPCDSFEWDGCAYGPDTATVIDATNNLVWSTGEIITTGTIGGAGSTENWVEIDRCTALTSNNVKCWSFIAARWVPQCCMRGKSATAAFSAAPAISLRVNGAAAAGILTLLACRGERRPGP